MKKMISIIVTFAFILSTSVCSFAEDTAEAAAKEVGRYGIMQGDPDGNLRLDDNVSRAEMVKMIVTALRIAPDTTGQQSFSDVPGNHWANGYIYHAHARNIVVGFDDGSFAPEDDVTLEQAIKMVVCALGYAPMAERRGGYPQGYITVANSNSICTGLPAETTIPATRGMIATLIANALDVPFMVEKEDEPDGTSYVVLNGKDGVALKTLRTELE